MFKNGKSLLVVLILAGIMLVSGLLPFLNFAAQAAPPAATTPELVTVWSSQALTQSTRSNAFNLSDYTSADVEVVIQGTDVNTASVAIDRSVSGYNWATHLALLTDNTSPTTVVTNTTLIGRYGSITTTLTTTDPVTITVLLWKRP